MNNIGKYVIWFLYGYYPHKTGKIIREDNDFFIVKVSTWEEMWLKRDCKVYNTEEEMFEEFNNRRKNIKNYL